LPRDRPGHQDLGAEGRPCLLHRRAGQSPSPDTPDGKRGSYRIREDVPAAARRFPGLDTHDRPGGPPSRIPRRRPKGRAGPAPTGSGCVLRGGGRGSEHQGARPTRLRLPGRRPSVLPVDEAKSTGQIGRSAVRVRPTGRGRRLSASGRRSHVNDSGLAIEEAGRRRFVHGRVEARLSLTTIARGGG